VYREDSRKKAKHLSGTSISSFPLDFDADIGLDTEINQNKFKRRLKLGHFEIEVNQSLQTDQPMPAVRSVSICVRERPRTFGNLANHSSPITERSRSFANKTAY